MIKVGRKRTNTCNITRLCNVSTMNIRKQKSPSKGPQSLKLTMLSLVH